MYNYDIFMTTLTNLRNNLFAYADEVKNNNKVIFVWKKAKKDFVIISFKEYKRLQDKVLDKKNSREGLSKFVWIMKNSKLKNLDDEDLKKEIRNIKYEYLTNKYSK